MNIGEKIKQRRIELNLSQNDLANETGLSRQYINKLETGKADNLTMGSLTKLMKALHCSIGFFLD